ncbi:MAG: hypothetical protein MZV64_02840 [Ignavibacteriales bacterium]|nr:hypothetical protein [Ignavibacteriales bacterium]
MGFTTGKISQDSPKVTLDKYLKWLDIVSLQLNSGKKLGVFNRWALEISQNFDPIPKNILLDLYDIEGKYFTNDIDDLKPNEVLNIPDLCKKVFEDEIDGEKNIIFLLMRMEKIILKSILVMIKRKKIFN